MDEGPGRPAARRPSLAAGTPTGNSSESQTAVIPQGRDAKVA
jgi:hypothetical protein